MKQTVVFNRACRARWKLRRLALTFLIWILASSSALAATTYIVRPGDTLYKIAQSYGVSLNILQSTNNIWGNDLYPGQKIIIPSQTTTQTTTYRVRPGDTLYLIGKNFGIPYQQIMSYNGLTSTTLRVGQTLIVPSGTGASTSRGTTGGADPRLTGYSSSDLNLLSHLIYGEARGEPYVGQVAIAAVVLNRVRNPNFPNTVAGVIFQPGAFTAVYDSQYYLTPNSTAIQAARDALNGWDPTGGALYYWNPGKTTNKWIWSRPIITTIGRHVFAI